jgi:hypothetical protein
VVHLIRGFVRGLGFQILQWVFKFPSRISNPPVGFQIPPRGFQIPQWVFKSHSGFSNPTVGFQIPQWVFKFPLEVFKPHSGFSNSPSTKPVEDFKTPPGEMSTSITL